MLQNVRREVFISWSRGERVRLGLDEDMNMEEQDGAVSGVVIVLPAPHLGHAPRQPLVHEGHNLLKIMCIMDKDI
jgi:hypothetical protein